MNWKQEAAEKLRKYEQMCLAVENLQAEIRRLERAAQGVGGGSRESGKSVTTREDWLIGNLARRQELEWNLEQTGRWLAVVDRGLTQLPEQDRLLLEGLFVRGKTGAVEDLCDRLGVEKSTLYRRRDEALRRFTLLLYGCTES